MPSIEDSYRIDSDYAEAVSGSPVKSDKESVNFWKYDPDRAQKAADLVYRLFTGFQADVPSLIAEVEGEEDSMYLAVYDSEKDEVLEVDESLENLAEDRLTPGD